MSDEKELSEEQIRKMERNLLGYDSAKPTTVELKRSKRSKRPKPEGATPRPAPRPATPTKDFVEVIKAGTYYHFMHVVDQATRKHLKTVEGDDRATSAANEFTDKGMRVIWK